MDNILYTDKEGKYNLLDYSRSHSQMLFRYRKDEKNVDIIFKSVQGLFISTEFSGVQIFEVTEMLNEVCEKYHFLTNYGYKVYAIKTSDNKLFYINAGVFGVFKNNLDILETSIGDFTWSNSNELIFWSE